MIQLQRWIVFPVRRNSFFALVILLLGMTVAANFVLAAADQEPISIEADQMESIRKNDAVVFTGNVEARQGEMAIHADEMTVYYRKASDSGKSGVTDKESIRKLIARGHVKIIRQDWMATGDGVEYLADERKVFLTGNTKVQQEGNVVSGERVVLFLDEGRSVIEGDVDGSRVKGVFYPKSKK